MEPIVRVEMDLFDSRANTHRPLFSIVDRCTPLGMVVLVHSAVCFLHRGIFIDCVGSLLSPRWEN